MGTTSNGLRYPEPTDPVAQGAVAIRNLAEDVNGKYPIIQTGKTNVAMTAGGGSITVTFPKPFTAPPVLALTCNAITGNVAVTASVTALTVTSFTCILRQDGGASFAGNGFLYWTAIL